MLGEDSEQKRNSLSFCFLRESCSLTHWLTADSFLSYFSLCEFIFMIFFFQKFKKFRNFKWNCQSESLLTIKHKSPLSLTHTHRERMRRVFSINLLAFSSPGCICLSLDLLQTTPLSFSWHMKNTDKALLGRPTKKGCKICVTSICVCM